MEFRKHKSLDLEVGTFSIQSYVVEIKDSSASLIPVLCLHPIRPKPGILY